MTRKTVTPAEGRKVRDPETGQPIAAAGSIVRWGPYWQRRLDDGDLSAVTDPVSPAKSAKATKKEA